ncbi:hypothetical protein PUR57_28450 [Streptomyces sp. JV176]|uniref:hypothetical protein n=1 Tax=Streptomyces sp. JV176 TaxID=858630 RepID=UPI002E7724E6|nr:hypothetical protein [Streptomyces sp. JV176]MEE1802571.1 hypothetical protein [Streptomyces sp. JV176]
MRSRLAARSTRLVLAAAAVTALAATTTACGPEEDGAAATTTSSSTESATSGGSDSSATGGSSDSGSDSGTGSGSKDSGSSGKEAGTDDGGKSGYGQSCGTNDLNFKVTSETQAGGYYLVTVSAKSGITCYLDPNTPSVSFGSDASGVASPVGQGGEDPIKLTGSAVAYTGISPKTTNDDSGVEFENVIIATSEEDENPAQLKLPEPAKVDKPIVTNWDDEISGAVPQVI